MLISVVIPTCNRPKTLIRCIESIKANNYLNYEIIVVDQSSDDETQELVKDKFNNDSRILYIKSNIKCSSNARNSGWQKANGEIIAFTDDDAFTESFWLRAYYDVFSGTNNTVGMAGGRVVPIYQTPRPSWLPPDKDFLLPSFDAGSEIKSFPDESLPMSVNFALPRSVLEKTGGFDIRLGLKSGSSNPYIGGEDSFLGMKVKEEGNHILYQPSAVVYHPIPAERLTKRFFIKRNYREGITAIELENIKTLCSKKRLSSHITWHFKRLILYGYHFFIDFIVPKRGRSKAYMLRAAEIAFSIGVIRHSVYLKKKVRNTE